MKKGLFLMVSMLILGMVFTGCSEITKISSPATVNTDDVIYKCNCVQSDTATGFSVNKIKPKGTWFMYNKFILEGDGDGDYGYWYGDIYVYQIVAGNPKNGANIIGQYWILPMEHNMYRAKYWINPTYVVAEEPLAISDSMNFTAAPGRDDNQDFGVPFYDADGEFYIFAHFAVECAK